MSTFQLHVSGLNMLSKCGIQFERRYIQGEKVPPGVGAVIGTATDRSITANLKNKIDTGSLLPVEAVTDIARDELLKEWDRGVLPDGDWEKAGDSAKGESIDHAVTLAALHHKRVAPRFSSDGLRVQREWVLDVKGLPIQLAGTIDIQEGSERVTDTKTSKKSPAADEADRSLQLTMYALAVQQLDGQPPTKVALDYLVKLKDPKAVFLESERKPEDFTHLLRRVQQAQKAIETGLFTPAPLDAWWCSKKWCGYHSSCPYARQPVSVAVPDMVSQLNASLTQIQGATVNG